MHIHIFPSVIWAKSMYYIRQNMVHNGIPHGYKKEGTLTFCNSMDGPGDYYAKSKEPVGERQIP